MNSLTKTDRSREAAAMPETPYVTPAVDIAETKEAYLLRADMPGVTKNGLEIQLEANELTIVGHRADAREGSYLHRESSTHDFRRTFVIDPTIDASRISAKIEQGVLTVHLPKTDQVKPRRINVTE
ncbi:MAG: Hsp20/alpha crystallin family protein [Verrucomicrobia bacterium]|nr:Hsp20/alpha crystallin family protein [Verrucomicrobiota bacterium]